MKLRQQLVIQVCISFLVLPIKDETQIKWVWKTLFLKLAWQEVKSDLALSNETQFDFGFFTYM